MTLTRPLTHGVANSPAAWTERSKDADPARACGWSAASQAARFTKILGELDPAPGSTLLDYGCGTGRLLDAIDPALGVRYVGIDWSLGMLERARRDHQMLPWAAARWVSQLRDGETWDYVVCCGTFNLADSWSKAQTWGLLRMLWARTRGALAVSLYSGHDPACLRYTMSECAEAVKGLPRAYKVSVEGGYLDNDVLLVLRR